MKPAVSIIAGPYRVAWQIVLEVGLSPIDLALVPAAPIELHVRLPHRSPSLDWKWTHRLTHILTHD